MCEKEKVEYCLFYCELQKAIKTNVIFEGRSSLGLTSDIDLDISTSHIEQFRLP